MSTGLGFGPVTSSIKQKLVGACFRLQFIFIHRHSHLSGGACSSAFFYKSLDIQVQISPAPSNRVMY